MIWRTEYCSDGSGEWQQSDTAVGEFVVDDVSGEILAIWYPAYVHSSEVVIGHYHTVGAAKRACKAFVKRMAAAFKACAKAGWE